ncbi:MAG: endonuclease [Chloroflexota bacterium]
MAVYLLHFDRPIGDPANPRGQAQHYLGYADDLDARIERHRAGNGAAIVRAVNQAGIGWTVARVWPDGDRDLERRLKRRHDGPGLCPICRKNGAAVTGKSHGSR